MKAEARIGRPDVLASAATRARLRALGHTLRTVEDWSQDMGHAHLIQFWETGVLCGAADPRGDGFAMGF